MASVGAVKVLNYCFTGGNEFEACKKFVDQFGSDTIHSCERLCLI
jgi:hypothetical protein